MEIGDHKSGFISKDIGGNKGEIKKNIYLKGLSRL